MHTFNQEMSLAISKAWIQERRQQAEQRRAAKAQRRQEEHKLRAQD